MTCSRGPTKLYCCNTESREIREDNRRLISTFINKHFFTPLHLIVKLPQGIKSLLPLRAFLSVRHYIWNRWLITQLLLHFGQRGYNLRRQIASFHRLSTPRSTVHRRKGSPKSRNYSPLVTIVQFLQTFNALPWKCFCSFWLIWFYKARACAFMMYVVVVVIVIVCGLTTCWRSQWRVKSVNC